MRVLRILKSDLITFTLIDSDGGVTRSRFYS